MPWLCPHVDGSLEHASWSRLHLMVGFTLLHPAIYDDLRMTSEIQAD